MIVAIYLIVAVYLFVLLMGGDPRNKGLLSAAVALAWPLVVVAILFMWAVGSVKNKM